MSLIHVLFAIQAWGRTYNFKHDPKRFKVEPYHQAMAVDEESGVEVATMELDSPEFDETFEEDPYYTELDSSYGVDPEDLEFEDEELELIEMDDVDYADDDMLMADYSETVAVMLDSPMMEPTTMDIKISRLRGASTMDLPPTVLKPSKYNSKMLPPSYYAGGMKPATMDLPPTVLKPSKYNSKMLPPSYYAGGMKPATMDLPPTVLKPSKYDSKMLPPSYYSYYAGVMNPANFDEAFGVDPLNMELDTSYAVDPEDLEFDDEYLEEMDDAYYIDEEDLDYEELEASYGVDAEDLELDEEYVELEEMDNDEVEAQSMDLYSNADIMTLESSVMMPTTMDLTPPTILKPSKYNSKMLPPSHYAGGIKATTMDIKTPRVRGASTTMDLPPTVKMPSKYNSKMLPPSYYLNGKKSDHFDDGFGVDPVELKEDDSYDDMDMLELEDSIEVDPIENVEPEILE